MAKPSLVVLDPRQAAITDLSLPDPPPTRVYISDRLYKLAAPRVPLPPIDDVVKCVLNWTLPAGRVARNIFYILTTGAFSTTSPSDLLAMANKVLNVISSPSGIIPSVASSVTLDSVTCKDCSGTTVAATSTGPPAAGGSAPTAFPPQVAVCMSWQVSVSYRGGKPRWYIAGLPNSANAPTGGATLNPTFAAALQAAGQYILAQLSTSSPPVGSSWSLGTVSYHSRHAVRPVPLFLPFGSCKVHERLDSQRRRSGPESGYAVLP